MLTCAHVPNFGLALALEGHPQGPAFLADKPGRGRVIEVSESAYALGARRGQTVLQACIAAGAARVLVHDPNRSKAVWEDVLDALDAISPLVESAAEGTAYLEMRGVDGSAAQWIAQTRLALEKFNLPLRVAAGPNKFTARAATYRRDGCICAEEEAAQLLAPLPLSVLDLEPLVLERLRLLGVQTLGELAQLPHGPLVRRFGKDAAAWHDKARGIDRSPFRPRPYEVHIGASLYGEGTAAQEEQVYFAFRVLADRICNDLSRAGRSAALLQVRFECENADVRELEAGFSAPTADPRTMLDVLRAKIEGMTFASPVSGLRLQVLRLEEGGTPASLFACNQPDPQAIAVAIARLEAIEGVRVHRARMRSSHLLEERFTFCHPEVRNAQPVPAGHAKDIPVRAIHHPQLRLLNVREIVVKTQGNAPQRIDTRAVVKCAGPWRVDDGWFDEHILRDEYDVQLEDGMLCRIYRQGERWYLRGAYD